MSTGGAKMLGVRAVQSAISAGEGGCCGQSHIGRATGAMGRDDTIDEGSMAQVRLDDGSLVPVAITRKRVRNLNLRVRADGSVTLSVPIRCSMDEAQAFLEQRSHWIGEHVARAKQRAAEREDPVPLEGPEALTLPLWGALVDACDALEIDVEGLTSLEDEELRGRVDGFYRREVERTLADVTEPLEDRLGARASSWQVRTMRTRWGSCTPKTGAIRINGALAAYPPECLEYVVAHELVHLVEPSHDERFHELLDGLCPNNREAHQLLKQPAREVARERLN